MSRELTVVLVLAAVGLSAGVGCVFMRISRRTPDAAVEAVKVLHRAEKAGWRDQLAAKDTEIARLNAQLLAAEQTHTHSITSGMWVTRSEYERVCTELATLRRAWEHGISFVADGDRPVIEHRHDEVA